jgi:hypothetical protein
MQPRRRAISLRASSPLARLVSGMAKNSKKKVERSRRLKELEATMIVCVVGALFCSAMISAYEQGQKDSAKTEKKKGD